MNPNLISFDQFVKRHLGPSPSEVKVMLDIIRVDSIENLLEETIPASIRLTEELALPEALTENEFVASIRAKGRTNQQFKTFIGMGYYNCHIPSVIQRNIFENPGWYTQYTPYQAEISQGRLEALLNFQTMVSDLTGLPIANASLLDEGTAAAEAMIMFFNSSNKGKKETMANRFLIDSNCFPQTIDVLKTRANPLGIELVITKLTDDSFDETVFGALLQFPGNDGAIENYGNLVNIAHENGSYMAVAADLLSLSLLTPPGELGADVAVGSTQRFGIPMGYGGPHAAYFASSDKFKRSIPGRIIGISVDANERTAYRMALQTREQHIRRERATSNICTAQALLAIMASMYGVYHGADGMRAIATKINLLAKLLDNQLQSLSFEQTNQQYFDTLHIDLKGNIELQVRIKGIAQGKKMNFRYFENGNLGISFDETSTISDVISIALVFADAAGKLYDPSNISALSDSLNAEFDDGLNRTSSYLQHPVFKQHRSETQMLRYIKWLENRDLSLTQSMIPLGSCTMKLNATSQLIPVSWSHFSNMHPFAPTDQARGYLEIIKELEDYLSEITGFAATSLQPNSGAQGEYAGLLVIKAHHEDKGQSNRNIALIPQSAHGTNPASAVMAGMKVVVVKCDEMGNIDVEDLRMKAELHSENLSTLMVTYPSTHGVFEESIREVCDIIHQNGGQVYMDGANMNAQVGLTNPAIIGADVCHLNLHKTFAIPHGGGGPGMGPICVATHLAPYLPDHQILAIGGEKAITAVSSAPWSSASILLISYGYIQMLGKTGLKKATEYAILNANYIKTKLENHYDVLYKGTNGRVAHELILDFRKFKHSVNISVEDVAKRLMDYGFHAPTVSFPVPGTIMIEPTESEDKAELDRFCEALIEIRKEIQEIEDGVADGEDNVLRNAPHTVEEITSDEWNHSYSREKAAFPLSYIRSNKFWPPVGRINNSFGDRILVCTCPAVESYMEAEV